MYLGAAALGATALAEGWLYCQEVLTFRCSAVVLVEKWVVENPGPKRSENEVQKVAVAAPSTAVFSLVQNWSEAHASLLRHDAGSYHPQPSPKLR
jgi:hypothetical protein